MKRLFTSALILFVLNCNSQIINGVINFQDRAMQTACIVQGFDLNNDNKIDTFEVSQVKTFGWTGQNSAASCITYPEMHYFKNLSMLMLSTSVASYQFRYHTIDLSKNINLTYLDLGIGSTAYIIDSIDLSKNKKLYRLEIGNSNFSSINLDSNLLLTTVHFSNSKNIINLDLSMCEYLSTVWIINQQPTIKKICLPDTARTIGNKNFVKPATAKWSQDCSNVMPTGLFDTYITESPTLAYPNPSSDIVNINGDMKRATVYDLSGNIVLTATNNQFNVSNLTSGIYRLSVEMTNGKILGSKLMVK